MALAVAMRIGSAATAAILTRVIGLAFGLLALVLGLTAWRRESRVLAAGFALALLARAVWSASRDDRWWMVIAGLVGGVLWILFDGWRGRRARSAAESTP